MKSRRLAGAAVLAAGTLLAASCSNAASPVSSGGGIDLNQKIAGQQITVLMPSYADLPAAIVKQFEDKTKVKVKVITGSWDNIHDEIVTASTGGQAVADVTEFDWSWTGQFSSAGWYEPLDSVLDSATKTDLLNGQAFTSDNHLMAACYSNDVRIGMYNTKLFAKAGITAAPKTFAELRTDLTKLRSTGASAHPMALSLSATEGTSTEWYLLTLMMGGSLFNAKNQPIFDQPNSQAAQALQFEVDAVKNGWAAPGATGDDDQAADRSYLGGQSAVQIAAHPGELETATTPGQSKIGSAAAYFEEPGVSGPGKTFGLPEGIGIPKASHHKAAAAAFIKWMTQNSTQLAVSKSLGLVPCGKTALHTFTNSQLKGGALIDQQFNQLTPLFSNGAPTWYGQFSTAAAAQINAAAKGNVSVDQALKQLAGTARQLASGG